MAVLVICKFDDDPIKNEGTIVSTAFSIISLWENFQRSMASSPIWPEIELVEILCLS